MKDQLFQNHTVVNAPLERVFDFFSDAKNLERLTPPFLQFKILEQSTPRIQQGTIFTYRLKIHGVPVIWKTLIEEWVHNSHFVDSQIKGPYKKWHHRHTFKAAGNATSMEDIVHYRQHLSPLSHWLFGKWIRSDVEKIFQYRSNMIATIFA